ncbi:acyl carrier protein [Pontibacter sp. BT310]|jgi:acyl carrier protein|uniref:Acyl carrier protein n=1 Tax=Pontibacter populi TaxID=890055 RepID=A0ABS6X8E5_9BACT|nr:MULTISPECIES: acyl carrier protein [Pontibacter]MBJ6116587.1 acyl carrier protein [Pontibacter sp. BT310]MBR0569011.1 acyl carrier protein [Microvirga sp. STS03]MBW3363440.1 acyl carrier protein [Pontibacter populi]
MTTATPDKKAIQKEVVKIITSVTNLKRNQLLEVRDLTTLGLDIVDVVDVILKVEKTYHLTIPDEVPVYTVDDFVNYVYTQTMKQAG